MPHGDELDEELRFSDRDDDSDDYTGYGGGGSASYDDDDDEDDDYGSMKDETESLFDSPATASRSPGRPVGYW